jgi:hypothetical protein
MLFFLLPCCESGSLTAERLRRWLQNDFYMEIAGNVDEIPKNKFVDLMVFLASHWIEVSETVSSSSVRVRGDREGRMERESACCC